MRCAIINVVQLYDWNRCIDHLQTLVTRGRFRGGCGGCLPPPPHPSPSPPLIFAITCLFVFVFFCNQFEEIQIALFEVALIINNAPLTYVNPNTIETCLTHNHLLFCRQWLFSSNTTLTVVRNPTVLSSTIDKINRISNHYLDRWKHEYVINLRETQQISKLNANFLKINVNGIVLVIYEKVPRHFWMIAIVVWILPSRDYEITWAIVRIAKTNRILKRAVNNFFTVENIHHDTNQNR